MLGAASPIVLSVVKLRCELPGRERYSSEADGLGRGGKSLETGRDGGSMRLSVSIDRDLTRDVFGRLAGWDPESLATFEFLLSVRHTEATFESVSLLVS